MRALKRFLLTLLAAIFLIEAWLWDHLEPVVERLVAALPLRALKDWFARLVEKLSPPATLIVFAVPAVILFPIKFLALWLIAHKHWLLAGVSFLAAKLVGLGLTAYIFDVTRPKLLQMPWFRRLHDTVMGWRDWAHALVDPYRAHVQRWVNDLRARYGGTLLDLLRRLRGAARNGRPR